MEDLISLSFSPVDLSAIITWSEGAAQWGVAFDLGTRAEAVEESLLVTLPGADEPAFSLWTTQGGLYCLEDWRRLGWDDDNVEITYSSLGMALRAIEIEITKCGRALRRVTV